MDLSIGGLILPELPLISFARHRVNISSMMQMRKFGDITRLLIPLLCGMPHLGTLPEALAEQSLEASGLHDQG